MYNIPELKTVWMCDISDLNGLTESYLGVNYEIQINISDKMIFILMWLNLREWIICYIYVTIK